jgi:hypothetical protein
MASAEPRRTTMYRDKPRKPSLPLITKDDDDKWREAVALLNELKLPVCRPSRSQLKSGRVNYYPATGTVTDDNFPRALPEHGLGALRRYLTRGQERVPRNASFSTKEPQSRAADPKPPDLIITDPQPPAADVANIELIITE